jgi:hypothetical protein
MDMTAITLVVAESTAVGRGRGRRVRDNVLGGNLPRRRPVIVIGTGIRGNLVGMMTMGMIATAKIATAIEIITNVARSPACLAHVRHLLLTCARASDLLPPHHPSARAKVMSDLQKSPLHFFLGTRGSCPFRMMNLM